MALFRENQKSKIVFEIDKKTIEIDCYISKIYYDRIKLELPDAAKRYFDYLKSGVNLKLYIFSQVGVIVQDSIVLTSPNERDFTVEYDYDSIEIKNRRNIRRYSSSCNLKILRPLHGDIETHLIDISIKGFRYYSEIPFEPESSFDCEIMVSDKEPPLSFKAKVLDNRGLPIGVYRMYIQEISFNDKQRLINYCKTLKDEV